MPPVFGPPSPSSRRLWSWAGSSGSTVVPSVTANSDTSGPSRYSSTSTAPPASSTRWPWATAAARSSVTSDALAGGQPVVLDDVRARPTSSSAVSSSAGPPTGQERAVGTPAAAMTCLAKDLLPSSCAASRRRPEAGDPGVADGVGRAGDQRHLGSDRRRGRRPSRWPARRRRPGRRRRPRAARRPRACRRCRARRPARSPRGRRTEPRTGRAPGHRSRSRARARTATLPSRRTAQRSRFGWARMRAVERRAPGRARRPGRGRRRAAAGGAPRPAACATR